MKSLEKIIEWADINNIEDLHWVEPSYPIKEGYWTGVPRDINKLFLLEELSINSYGENTTDLPEEIGLLTNLKKLSLSCKCKLLPNSITNLKNLEVLLLSVRGLEELPSGIKKLNKLKKLSLQWSNIQILPDDIGKLENLEVIMLEHNSYDIKLPLSIVNLKKLKALYLPISYRVPLKLNEWLSEQIENGVNIPYGETIIKKSNGSLTNKVLLILIAVIVIVFIVS